jgi:hypothetical protein
MLPPLRIGMACSGENGAPVRALQRTMMPMLCAPTAPRALYRQVGNGAAVLGH